MTTDLVKIPARLLGDDGDGVIVFDNLPPEMGTHVTCPHCGDREPLLIEGPVEGCMRVVCTTCGAAGPLVKPGYGERIARHHLHLEADEEMPEPIASMLAAYAVWATRLAESLPEDLQV